MYNISIDLHKLYNYNRKPIGPVLVQCSTVVSKYGFIVIAIAIIYIPAIYFFFLSTTGSPLPF